MSILSIRLPDDLDDRLEGLSSSLNRPKSYLIRKAIEIYLVEYAEYRMARDRLYDKHDPMLSSAALRKKFGEGRGVPNRNDQSLSRHLPERLRSAD